MKVNEKELKPLNNSENVEELKTIIDAEEPSGGTVPVGKRTPVQWAVRIVAILFTFYMFYATVYGPYKTTIVHRALFLIVMAFIFFAVGKPLKFKDDKLPKLARTIDWIFIAAVVLCGGYIVVEYKTVLALFTANQLSKMQVVIAAALVIVVLEMARRTSKAFFFLALIGVAYSMFGNYLSGPLNHAGISFKRLVYLTSYTEEGIFGLGLSVASTYLFMFIMFGACLQGTGAANVMMDFCNGLFGRYDGGPAKTSVVSSALMGTISGSSISNVVTTGSITIPLMKKLGFRPHVAAAIEVTASEGGQLMPPIMGAAAFIMAEMTGIAYKSIAVAAIIPALLYFVNAFLIVHFEAKKSGLHGLPKEQLPDWKKTIKGGWHLLMPIAMLFYLLLGKSYTTMFSGMVCILLLIVAAMVRRGTRMTLRQILDMFEQGVRDTAGVMAILCGLGLVTQAVTVTGLGARITTILVGAVGGNLIAVVIVAMIVTIILGCGMTTPIAYSLVAIFVAPALIQVGFPVLAAHMFLFFFAIKSGSTPPVAVVAAVAAGIAKADFWKTAFKGTAFGVASYLVAFGYLFNPALLLMGEPLFITQSCVTALIGVFAMASGIQGWMFSNLNILERVMLIGGAVCMIVSETVTDIIGIALVLIPVIISLKNHRKVKEIS